MAAATEQVVYTVPAPGFVNVKVCSCRAVMRAVGSTWMEPDTLSSWSRSKTPVSVVTVPSASVRGPNENVMSSASWAVKRHT